MPTSAEFELIRKAQQGDMLAFTELVQRHDRVVFALAARYVTSAEDAKDIFQEVMIKVFHGLPGFRFQSEFSTWLHRITVNVCLTHRSQSRNVLHVPLGPPDGGSDNGSGQNARLRSSMEGPDDATINADTANHIQRALQSLSPRQRMVFTLRHFEGHSLKEIAGMLRCREGTVKRYLFTATRRMRDQLHHLL